MRDALVIVAATSADRAERRHADVAAAALEHRYRTTTIDLVELGLDPAMSRSERAAYHSPHPLVDETIAVHARLVSSASALVFVFPTEWWTPPALLEAWVERTFVPGVAFVFDERNRISPNLTNFRGVAGITRQRHPRAIRTGGDGARRMLLRTLRLNAPRRVRSAWVTDPTDGHIASAMHRL